jgi:hypothetical protein
MLNEVGLLDENFTFAFDDVDICLRIYQSRWQIHYVPSARIMHEDGFTLRQLAPILRLKAAWFNGLLVYFRKQSPRQFLALRLIFLAALLFRIPVVTFVALLQPRNLPAAQIHWEYLWIVLRSFMSPLPDRPRTMRPDEVPWPAAALQNVR